MDELLEQFLIEGRELVQQASDDLLALDRAPNDAGLIDSSFRAVHTLKGSVGLFDFKPMGDALHAAEDLLAAMRERRLTPDSPFIDLLLNCVGQCERWLDAIASTLKLPSDAEEKSRRLTASLRARLNPELTPVEHEPTAAAWVDELLRRRTDAEAGDLTGSLLGLRYTPHPECFFSGDDPIAFARAIPELVLLRIGQREPWPDAAEFDVFRCNLVIDALTRASKAEVQQVFRFIADQVEIAEIAGSVGTDEASKALAEEPERNSEAGPTSRALRIDAARIDALADIAGELVVAKNSLAHLSLEAEAGTSDGTLARGIAASQATLDRLVGELHRAVMSARMAPLNQTFRRFPRLAREIAGQLGKEVVFSTAGESLEADKTVVDGLFEPLLHVVRNAIDHGIEPGPVRQALGKPARGAVSLSARQEGDEIILEVADDGAGVDPANIRRVAAERGLGSEEALAALGDAVVANLIFAPGFSTAKTVTNVSGRGVGMDAVRSGVEKMGGRVGLTSTPGAGSTIRLTVPTTVVLTRVMVVRVGAERFGVPMGVIVETTRVPIDRVIPIRGGEAFVFRDRTLPLLRLSRLLGLAGADAGATDLTVLVIAHGESLAGVAVDGFAGRIDVVLRPLEGLLSSLPGVRGATVMGDGQVLMALDLAALIE